MKKTLLIGACSALLMLAGCSSNTQPTVREYQVSDDVYDDMLKTIDDAASAARALQ